jgi:hypothetical protein
MKKTIHREGAKARRRKENNNRFAAEHLPVRQAAHVPAETTGWV